MDDADDMEWWRKYFAGSGTDIWTVIREALNLAALDYPQVFKERRADIGEILFSRNLLDLHLHHPIQCLNKMKKKMTMKKSIDSDAQDMRQPLDVHEEDTNYHDVGVMSKRRQTIAPHRGDANGNGDVDDNDQEQILVSDRNVSSGDHCFQDEAAVLSDQLEEERINLMEISNIKETISDQDQSESSLFEALRRLQLMDLNIHLLQETMIGRHVKRLQKHSSQRVCELAKHLISHWKYLVDEYQDNLRRTSNTATSIECGELHAEEPGLPEPPFDAAALWASSATDFSLLVNFMRDETCEQAKDKCKPRSFVTEPSVKDHSLSSSRSHTESLLTDSSDFDTKASTNCSEDKINVFRDDHRIRGVEKKAGKLDNQLRNKDDQIKHKSLFPKFKGTMMGSGPGRPFDDVSKTEIASYTNGKVSSEPTSLSKNNTRVVKAPAPHPNVSDKMSNSETEKSQVEKKLEISKRKLHQGYEQAEKAKRQRTVQVLDIPDLPKDRQVAMVRGSKGNRPGNAKAGILNRSVKPTRR